jgi:tetratricopeptide (TPR) repeat protein
MSEQEKVKALLKEAVVYKSQGLFQQAKERFQNALEIMNENESLRANAALIATIREKLREMEETLEDIEEDEGTPELSEDVRELIKKSFSFSKDKEAAAIEGAMALAKFGQFDKALDEFNEILEYATLPMMIAKNIIRCHLSLGSHDGAVKQFKEWIGGNRFSREEIIHLKDFLSGLLESRGIEMDLPALEGGEVIAPAEEPSEEDELDISSVNIQLESGPQKGLTEEFPVELQSGDSISIVVPPSSKEMVRMFRHGMRLSEIQCFSPIGFFPASGTVTGKNKVLQGPNKGSFMVEIKLDD